MNGCWSRATRILLGTWLLAGAAIASASGTELVATEDASQRVERLKRKLDSESFAERREASLELRRMGAAAIPSLIEAAEKGSAEARTRSLELIEVHFREGGPELQEQARAALEQLAEGDGVAARHAKLILHPTPPSPQPMFAINPAVVRNRRVLVRPQQVVPARPQAPAVQQAKRFRITSVQGGKRIRIAGDENGMDVEITETKDGKEVTEKFQVKNLEELKQRSAESHELVQRFQERNGGGRLLDRRLEQLDKQITELQKRLPLENADNRPALQRQIETLERMQQQIRAIAERQAQP